MRVFFVVFWSVLATAQASAQGVVTVPGSLSDAAFHRLVACGGTPMAPCASPMLRWSEDDRLGLSVGIAGFSPSIPEYRLTLIDRALDHSISQINGLGAALFLERSAQPPFDILIYILDLEEEALIAGTGLTDLDGHALAEARIALSAEDSRIVRGAIALNANTPRREVTSVLLESLIHALGLTTDVQSPAYERSIFAEDRNVATRLFGQDAEVIRQHYPIR